MPIIGQSVTKIASNSIDIVSPLPSLDFDQSSDDTGEIWKLSSSSDV